MIIHLFSSIIHHDFFGCIQIHVDWQLKSLERIVYNFLHELVDANSMTFFSIHKLRTAARVSWNDLVLVLRIFAEVVDDRVYMIIIHSCAVGVHSSFGINLVFPRL